VEILATLVSILANTRWRVVIQFSISYVEKAAEQSSGQRTAQQYKTADNPDDVVRIGWEKEKYRPRGGERGEAAPYTRSLALPPSLPGNSSAIALPLAERERLETLGQSRTYLHHSTAHWRFPSAYPG